MPANADATTTTTTTTTTIAYYDGNVYGSQAMVGPMYTVQKYNLGWPMNSTNGAPKHECPYMTYHIFAAVYLRLGLYYFLSVLIGMHRLGILVLYTVFSKHLYSGHDRKYGECTHFRLCPYANLCSISSATLLLTSPLGT